MVVVLSTDDAETFGGSIGTTWPPGYDGENDRVKGFYTEVVDEEAALRQPIHRLEYMQDETDAGRVSCRFLVQADVIDGEEDFQLDREAVIPLDGRWDGYDLVYFGTVSPERRPADLIADQYDELLHSARSRERQYSDQAIELIEAPAGYQIGLTEAPTSDLLGSLQALYESRYTDYPIAFTMDNIRALFEGDNQVAVAYDGDELVGAYVAEVASVPMSSVEGPGSLRMAELTEAATRREHEGSGIGTALGRLLIDALGSYDIDLIYGEARADLAGVNVSAATMGRRLYGRLPSHCRIGGDTTDIDYASLREEGVSADVVRNHQDSPYGTLNVWAITGEERDERY